MKSSIVASLAITILSNIALAHPSEDKPTKVKRNILDEASSVIASLASTIPTEVSQGILPAWDNLPSDADIKKQFNLTDADIAALPVNVLDIPGYANYTDDNWLLRIHGQAYKTPVSSGPKLVDAANAFIPKLDVSQLEPYQQANALNLTAAIYSLPVEGLQLYFDVTANGSDTSIIFPNLTDSRGEFDKFIALSSANFSLTNEVKKVDIHVNGIADGNATAYLVPPEGVTIVSDIDDILRVTKIYQPEQGLNNTFVNNFTAWMNMPDIYAKWAKEIPGVHFTYATTTPEPGTRAYMQFIYATYPLGSFDTRPYNFTTSDQIFQIRDVILKRIVETFPKRKIILIADTSNSDVMRDYPSLPKLFPSTKFCILLRNTSSTDPSDHFPYNTAGFEGLDNSTYMFFNVPDDLSGLNFTNGDCRNASIQQNVTFGYQGLPSLKKNTASKSLIALSQTALFAIMASIWFLL